MSLIPKKGTVYVVDDDEAVRDSLQWLLEGKDYRVKCFDSAESFLSRFDPREVACLIADIRMDGMSGLELQDKLLERRSPLPVTFITGHGGGPMAVTTMKKGAEDFIEKPFKEEELVALVEKMLDRARVDFSKHQEAASRDALLSRLTTREAQVLERIVAGRLNKQIADDLGISIKTVEAHRGHPPGLAVILVGEDPASQVYVKHKVNDCAGAGIRSVLETYPADLAEDALLARIAALNADATIHGILVQMPLPKHIHPHRVIE